VPNAINWAGILASNVRSRRKELRLSQEELAHRVGVDVRYLGGIERMQENPSLKVIVALAMALNCTPIDLLTCDY
jgi:transcriptional regulator with XRE-family HTH domain